MSAMHLIHLANCAVSAEHTTFVSCFFINIFHSPAALFVDGDVLYSNEGTTQGNPLAMLFYVL